MYQRHAHHDTTMTPPWRHYNATMTPLFVKSVLSYIDLLFKGYYT